MPVRTATAEWHGSISEGTGRMQFADWEGPYSAGSRFEEEQGTNPEELLGAAHAGCFSMALASALSREGHPPESVSTRAEVHIEKLESGWTVTRSHLTTSVAVDGLDEARLQELAAEAKEGCPVSRALAGVDISLEATLAG